MLQSAATYNRFTPANINFYNWIKCMLGALQFLNTCHLKLVISGMMRLW